MRGGATVVLVAGLAGCIDFDRFTFPRDASAPIDRLDAALPDLPAPPPDLIEVGIDRPRDLGVDRTVDSPMGCQPGRAVAAMVRVAHMAPEVGPIDLCIQKRGRTPTTSMTRIQAATWPAGGLEYGQVSRPVEPNSLVTASNEAWDVAVVARGTPCESVPGSVAPLASRSIQLDPGTLRLLVITSEPSLDGHLVPFINLLSDSTCTDCTQGSVDVRAVHASLGASTQRLTFSLYPQWMAPSSLLPMRTFATGVSFGGDQSYACNQLWGAAVNLFNPPVQLEVTTTTGRLIARSGTFALKRQELVTRTVTVFFEGDFGESPGTQAPGFVVCYDGRATGLLSTCERVSAVLPASDAGADATDAPTDVDASDDVVTSVTPPDASLP